MSILTREQLEQRLIALHKASVELVKDISLESVLERIAVLACEQAGARYAALGVINDQGKLEQFIPVGMSKSEINKMAHPPLGLGLIGALMQSHESIRLADLTKDARSSGYPENHPDHEILPGCTNLPWRTQSWSDLPYRKNRRR